MNEKETTTQSMSQKPGNMWMGHVPSLHGRWVTSLSESLVWSLAHTLKKTPGLEALLNAEAILDRIRVRNNILDCELSHEDDLLLS